MSDEPGSSGIPPSQPARTVRKRRPTNLPPDQSPKNEVKILRPSEVPRRQPLPEYAEPADRRLAPKDTPLDRLHELQPEACRDVVIPTFVTSDELLVEADRVDGLVSFRSTNYVPPEQRMDGAVARGGMDYCFAEKNRQFLGKTHYGCTAFDRIGEKNKWDLVIEAPKGSAYEGGVFFAQLTFFPSAASRVPSLKFRTMMFHPKLGKFGDYDMSDLGKVYEASSTIDAIFKYLFDDLLNLKTIMERKSDEEVEQMVQPDLGRLAKHHWEKFEDMAKLMTLKMAGNALCPKSKHSTVAAEMSSSFTYTDGWRRVQSPDIDVVND